MSPSRSAVEQTTIALCGIATVWLSQDPDVSLQRWACVVGLIAQPFWLTTTYRAKQWGMFVLAIGYTLGFMRGVWTFWLR